MNDILDISSVIYNLDGTYVILCSDLAKILNLETKYLNRIINRNITLFNNNSILILNDEQSSKLFFLVTNRHQINTDTRGGKYKNPKVLTYKGITTLNYIVKNIQIKNKLDLVLSEFDKLNSKNIITIKDKNIRDMIFKLNGIPVILDSDLANLFECKNGTKEINQALKNNIEKFPEEYFYHILDSELINLKSKILTSSLNNYGGSRKGHNVFTEKGVLMLATIIHTKVAIETSIKIIDAFVVMKHYLTENGDIYKSITNINNKLNDHSEKIELLMSNFNIDEKIYLPGNTYNAYSDLIKIFKEATKSIVIIDSYADINLLDIIKNFNIKILLITTNKKLTTLDIKKYNSEYHNLSIIYSNIFHDRFIIIDNKKLYHIGSSINSIGKKIFMINLISDKTILNMILKEIKRLSY